jgi:hypothetical protein
MNRDASAENCDLIHRTKLPDELSTQLCVLNVSVLHKLYDKYKKQYVTFSKTSLLKYQIIGQECSAV